MPNPKPFNLQTLISPIRAYCIPEYMVCQALNTAQKMQKNITKRYNNITKCYNTKPKYLEIWEKINGLRNVFYSGYQGYFSIPAPAGPPPAAGYLTRIVIPSILIVLNLALQHLIQYLGSGYLSGQVPIFYGLRVLDKRYKVWYTAKLSAGGTLRGIVMSFSKMGGDLKKDRNTYNPIIRYIRFEVWGYEVWDRNGFLGLGCLDCLVCQYLPGGARTLEHSVWIILTFCICLVKNLLQVVKPNILNTERC